MHLRLRAEMVALGILEVMGSARTDAQRHDATTSSHGDTVSAC
jgi:hypothetical protein